MILKIITVNFPNNGAVCFYNAAICAKEADGMANSSDPDQVAPPIGTV